MNNIHVYDLTYEALKDLLTGWGEPAFRADQVFSWLHQGVPAQEMTNLSQSLREKLSQTGLGGVAIEETLVSKDGTKKFLFRCQDGLAVEGVLMPNNHGNTLCISTQAGCRMGCRFCASTQAGLARNLTAGELGGQLYAVRHALGPKAFTHVVLMGCGEPLDNYDNVLDFLRIISHPKGMNLSLRHISLSTCGLVPQIEALAKENLPLTLCLSLHAPNDTLRQSLMPIAAQYPLNQVIPAMKRYEQQTGRRVVFEYLLIEGVNDHLSQARELAAITKGIRKHINLIPYNTARGNYQASSEQRVQGFLQELLRLGASATIRKRQGDDIVGACGQLRLQTIQGS